MGQTLWHLPEQPVLSGRLESRIVGCNHIQQHQEPGTSREKAWSATINISPGAVLHGICRLFVPHVISLTNLTNGQISTKPRSVRTQTMHLVHFMYCCRLPQMGPGESVNLNELRIQFLSLTQRCPSIGWKLSSSVPQGWEELSSGNRGLTNRLMTFLMGLETCGRVCPSFSIPSYVSPFFFCPTLKQPKNLTRSQGDASMTCRTRNYSSS